MLDLEPATRTVQRIADGIDDHGLDGPTPCDVPVAQLLAHVLGLGVAFREAGRKVRSEITGTPPGLAEGTLPPDWRQQLPVVLDELVQAWRDPAAWEGTTHIAGIDLPGAETGMVVNNELVVHGWDLAVATGQPYEQDPANLEASWQLVSATPDVPEVREGMFGRVVTVPPDAPLVDRVVAGAGRDPRWSPGRWASRSGSRARG